jgi:hypothetical protein
VQLQCPLFNRDMIAHSASFVQRKIMRRKSSAKGAWASILRTVLWPSQAHPQGQTASPGGTRPSRPEGEGRAPARPQGVMCRWDTRKSGGRGGTRPLGPEGEGRAPARPHGVMCRWDTRKSGGRGGTRPSRRREGCGDPRGEDNRKGAKDAKNLHVPRQATCRDWIPACAGMTPVVCQRS